VAGVLRLQHVSVPIPPDRADEARAFYTGALGMTEVPVPDSLKGVAVLWFKASDDGDEVHLYAEKGPTKRVTGQHFCLQIDDIAALANELEAKGIHVEETIVIPGRPRRMVFDPFGNQIELSGIRLS
jgi:catechol 2,3-dioxygenase-like lactoylglutathione lyase family enzyme